MASSFRGAFCMKPSKGVFGAQSYIQDGAFAKKAKGLNVPLSPSQQKVSKNVTFKQIIRNFA